MPETAILVLGGEAPSPELLTRAAMEGPVYAADSGARACLRAGIRPVFVLGDGDSVRAADLPPDWEFRLREDQAFTDFEKLLRELPDGLRALQILGGFGGRLDHAWNNLLIAARVDPRVRVVFEDDACRLIRVTPETPLQFRSAECTLSLLPLGGIRGVETTGLRWNLANEDLGGPAGISQSNRVLPPGEVDIRLQEGVLYAWVELARCIRPEAGRDAPPADLA